MVEPSIPECFRLLKVGRGADFSAVKEAYRRNLNKCHPDRFQTRPELIPVAERKTKRLIQVYGILERWYLDNGGVDRPPPRGEASQGPADTQDLDPEEGIVPPRSRRFGVVAAVVAVIVILGTLTWWFGFMPQEDHRPAPAGGGGTTASAQESVIPAPILPTDEAARQPGPTAEPFAQSMTMAAQLGAIVAERDRVKSIWIAGYMHDWGAERELAQRDFAAAQAQYASYTRDHAADIKEAADETARQVALARRESQDAKDAFARRLPAELDALRRSYDDWLIAQGKDAVALVQEIRKRENSDLGVFSDTEDPGRIFEFWTAEEAGGPEITIAAKTGVTVLQPDSRFFPHFRSNIFLFDPEGQVLVRMMGSIAGRHDALMKEIGDKKAEEDATLANWDATHPMAPVQLLSSLQLAMEERDRSMDRLANARARLNRSNTAYSLSRASDAFARSPGGKKWSDRVAAAQAAAEPTKAAR